MGKKRETLYFLIEYQPAQPLSGGKTVATLSTSAKSELIKTEHAEVAST